MTMPCRRAGAWIPALSLALAVAAATGIAAAGQAQGAGPTNDLEVGIAFISEGDFEAAAETLEAVTFILDGQPEGRADLARASVYLGWALLYTDSETAAMQRFYDARRSDPQFEPPPTQFPRRVIRLWNAAGGRVSRPRLPPPAPEEKRRTRGRTWRSSAAHPSTPRRGCRGAASGWSCRLALAGADQPCPGRDARRRRARAAGLDAVRDGRNVPRGVHRSVRAPGVGRRGRRGRRGHPRRRGRRAAPPVHPATVCGVVRPGRPRAQPPGSAPRGDGGEPARGPRAAADARAPRLERVVLLRLAGRRPGRRAPRRPRPPTTGAPSARAAASPAAGRATPLPSRSPRRGSSSPSRRGRRPRP